MTFVSYVGEGKSFCVARCECGSERQLRTDGFLRSQFSCGCRAREIISTAAIERQGGLGMFGSTEYNTWASMLGRCRNPNNTAFHRYGGRGIVVCERWNKFANFFADMGKKPGPNYSIDRYPNNDGNYEPGNCRWATNEEQSNNRSSNVVIEKAGNRFTVSQLARGAGIRPETALSRKRRGYSDEQLLAPTSSVYRKNLNNSRWKQP